MVLLFRSLFVFPIALAFLATTNGCGKSKSNSKAASLTLAFKPVQTASTSLTSDDQTSTWALLTAGQFVAQNILSTDIKSLKYRINAAILCKNLAATGSGANCSGGGLSLYSQNGNSNAYDAFMSQQAYSDDTGYIDFMDPASVAKLTQNIEVKSEHVGAYDSTAVYWFRPFKVKAEVTAMDGSGAKIYTKKSNDFLTSGTGLGTTIMNRTTGMLTAPADEAVLFLPNGGTYTKFQNKFEITQADLDNSANFKAIFAYDTVAMIKGRRQNYDPNQTWLSGQQDTVDNVMIEGPFLQVAPVMAKASETIEKETYLLTYPGGESVDPHQVRLSLYTIKEDEKRSIRAVTANVVFTTSTTQAVMNFPTTSSFSANSDGTINLLDWSGIKLVSGLKRTTTVGPVGTVVHEFCVGTQDQNGCSQTATRSYTYALEALQTVDGPRS